MAYGVSYGGKRNPSTYGVNGSRSLASMFGNQLMQPLSSARPQGFAPIGAPTPMDALGRVMQNSQNVFQSIAPNTGYGALNPGTTTTPPSGTPAPLPSFTTSPSPPVSPAPSSSYQGTDLSADPILNQIKDIGRRSVSDAATSGLAGAKNDLINFGGIQVPQSLRDLFTSQTPTNDALLGDLPGNPVLAALNDAGTQQAAADNPFSTSAQLSNAHQANVHNLDQTSNLANLFYSSTHANQLGDESNAYLGSQNSALQALAQALSGDNTGLLDALNHAHDQYVAELPNAYGRAIAAGGSGAAGGAGGAGGGNDGNGGGGDGGGGAGGGNNEPSLVTPPILPSGTIPQPGRAYIPANDDFGLPPTGGGNSEPSSSGMSLPLTAPDYRSALALANTVHKPVAALDDIRPAPAPTPFTLPPPTGPAVGPFTPLGVTPITPLAENPTVAALVKLLRGGGPNARLA